FAAMSLIWGLTWFPAKIALAVVPPLLFTGTRFLVAGLILAAWVRARGGAPQLRRLPGAGVLGPRRHAVGAGRGRQPDAGAARALSVRAARGRGAPRAPPRPRAGARRRQ